MLREGGNLLVVLPIEASISLVLVRLWSSRPERAVAGAARAAVLLRICVPAVAAVAASQSRSAGLPLSSRPRLRSA